MNIQWYGFRRDAKDARDRIFRASGDVPSSVDLSAHCPPVMDQGELGSCTAHGISGAWRWERLAKKLPDYEMSRLQLYYDERAIEGTVKSDAGAEIRDGIKCLGKTGIAHESLWPYLPKKFASKPTKKVYADALKDTDLTYTRVNVPDIKAALAGGHPVVIGISVFNQFESADAAKTGVIAMPGTHDAPIGGHCMYAIGYGQKPGYITVRNSWAADWGAGGNCFIPEAYLTSTKYGSDYWILA